jgi:putative transposase
MAYDPEKHHRRSIRLEGFDYREEGAYFITLCTRHRARVFGEIVDGAMKKSRRGIIASDCWLNIKHHRGYIELDEFVVMPNHVHGIFWIFPAVECRATQVSPLRKPRLLAGSVGSVVGAYKASVSRAINKLRPGAATDFWQPNYFEHIVRDQRGLEALREYIFTNPQRWLADVENPQGDGTDDVERFVAGLYGAAVKTQGDASVAPTGASRA